MSFLRRLFGGGDGGAEPDGADGTDGATAADSTDAATTAEASDTATAGSADPVALEEEERAHELELARQEAARLDELQQRQLRFADYAWTPPAQGGEKRADDEERPTDG